MPSVKIGELAVGDLRVCGYGFKGFCPHRHRGDLQLLNGVGWSMLIHDAYVICLNMAASGLGFVGVFLIGVRKLIETHEADVPIVDTRINQQQGRTQHPEASNCLNL